MDFVCKIAGQAGAGVMVTGRLMVKCFTRGGYHAIGYPEYPSLIRGGHNTVQVRVSEAQVNGPLQNPDLIIALNKDAIFYHMDSMAKGGIIIYDQLIDTSKFRIRSDVHMHALPLSKLTQDAGGTEQMKNTVALGAALAAVEYPFEVLEGIIRDEFKRKGEEVIRMNIGAARAGYDYVKTIGIKSKVINPIQPIPGEKNSHRIPRRILVTGNEAMALGAVRGGLKFYAAYPMTPASSILHFMVEKERLFNIVVKQTEDEIAAINYAIGASYAGARSMVGTSGGGFALMVEALGMAAISETPLVIALVQRSGPSTGLPTWTEQADLRFALHASQGDFLRVILAPGDVDECFSLTAKALNLAEKYQIPVIVLSDKHLGETVFSTEEFDQKKIRIERGKIANNLPPLPELARWKRYELTKDGISPRALPGTPNGMHVASSYEHDETGSSTENFIMRSRQVEKRASKLKSLLREMSLPNVYGPKKAAVTLVCWGSTKLPALDALTLLEQKGVKANILHFNHLFPLDERAVKKAVKAANKGVLIMVENNSTAQFADILKQYAGVEADFHLLKYDGRHFFPEQIAEEILKLKKKRFKAAAGSGGKKDIIVMEKENTEYYAPYRYGL